jgi:ribosomal protein S18 acetylase RimI-like enzyme
MHLPAETSMPVLAPVDGVTLRTMRDEEEPLVLEALNRAWTGTWNFVPITADMLAEDLNGQREGMLLAVGDDGRILATCHGIYQANGRNPDGHPRAWISNLTVDPEMRNRGLARLMLVTAINQLRTRGARSVGLGVDSDNPAPYRLYESVGFQVLMRLLAWDLPLVEDQAT